MMTSAAFEMLLALHPIGWSFASGVIRWVLPRVRGLVQDLASNCCTVAVRKPRSLRLATALLNARSGSLRLYQ